MDYNPTPGKSWPVFHSHIVAKVMLCCSVEVVMFGESLPVEVEIAEIAIALLLTQGDWRCHMSLNELGHAVICKRMLWAASLSCCSKYLALVRRRGNHQIP